MELTYTEVDGYFYPDLTLPETESACALGIFSGKIFYNRATADSLRAVRCCIFTERAQKGNLIGLCLFPAETAAQPGNRQRGIHAQM